jgi:hypothetical protein
MKGRKQLRRGTLLGRLNCVWDRSTRRVWERRVELPAFTGTSLQMARQAGYVERRGVRLRSGRLGENRRAGGAAIPYSRGRASLRGPFCVQGPDLSDSLFRLWRLPGETLPAEAQNVLLLGPFIARADYLAARL